MGINSQPTKVLFVGDNEEELVLIRSLVTQISIQRYRLHWVKYDDARNALFRDQYDVCLLGYRFGEKSGLDFLKESLALGCKVPIIFLTDQANSHVALEAMEAGASDYVSQADLTPDLLERSIRYSCARRGKELYEESEVRFRALVEASSQVLYRMNPDWSEMLKLEGGGFIKNTKKPNPNWLSEYIHPDDQKSVIEAIGEAVRTKTIFEFEHRVKRVDGTLGWTNSRAVPVLNAAGEVVEWFGAASDITERKRGEEERERLLKQLQDQNSLLKTIFENTPAGIAFMRGPEFAYEIINPLFQAIIPGKQVVGKTFKEVWPEIADEFLPILEHVRRTGEPYHIADALYRIRRAPGSQIEDRYFNVVIAKVFDEDAIIGVAAETTEQVLERRKAEDERAGLAKEVDVQLNRLQAILDSLPVGVWITNHTGKMLVVNDIARQIWGEGAPVAESISDYGAYKAWWIDTGGLISAEDMPLAHALKGELIREKGVYFERFDGSRGTQLVSASPIKSGEGEIIGSVAIVQDISNLQQMEDSLRESKEQLSMALQAGNAGLWIWNPKTDEVHFDERFHEMLGYSSGELPSTVEKWLLYHHPEDLPEVRSKAEAYLSGDIPKYESEYRIRSKAGIWNWILTRGRIVHRASSGSEQVIGIAINITDRKDAEAALRQREEEFRVFVESAPDVISLFDRDLRRIYVNFHVIENTGFDASFYIGKTLAEAGYPDSFAQPLNAALQKVLATGHEETIEVDYEGPQGCIWLQIRCAPIRDIDGSVLRVITIGRDITASKKNEESLKELNDELERRVELRTKELQETQAHLLHAEKLSAIGRLSASIAHEFNNPLQGIMTILKGFKQTLALEKQDRVLLDLAFSESERMKNLIRSLQDFNRPSSGRKVLMDLHATIDSLILLSKSDFKRRGISTILNYDKTLPQIQAVQDQIKQVILNLLQNAADACSGSNGVITIFTWQDGERIAVAIKDNGIGIPPNKIDQIFQPFYTTKPEVKGTGLGLSICHGIVQNHQGEIRVESEPGKGSTFIVMLPIVGERM